MALAGGDFERATPVDSIDTIKEAQDKAHEFNVQIRGVNTDRYTKFCSNKNPETSEFEHYLKREGIKHIPSIKGNPQTNGKLERLWLEYNRHRWKFESIEAF